MTQEHSNAKRGKIIQIDEDQVKDHLGEIVRGTVQECWQVFYTSYKLEF